MNTILTHTRSILSFLILLFAAGCASRGVPGGGPQDRIPPEIVATYPPADSTNVGKLSSVHFIFSERMDENTVRQALNVSPPLKFEIEWSGGDELTLELTDSLKINRTYVFTIGAQAKDAHGNQMAESFQFAFATGPVVDRGKISGRIFNIRREDPFYIFAYRLENTAIDTAFPNKMEPDYLTQAGENGVFSLGYLALGDFRVFAVEDQNLNLRLDADFERLGIPQQDIRLDSAHMEYPNLNFQVTRTDTTVPFATGARAVENRKVLLRISENVVDFGVNNVIVTDSATQQQIAPLAIGINPGEEKQYYIYVPPMDSAAVYRVSVFGLQDTSGNLQTDTSYLNFSASTYRDTTKFELLALSPADSLVNIILEAQLLLDFSLPVDSGSVIRNTQFIDADSQKVAGIWNWENLQRVAFQPLEKLKPGETYRYRVSTGGIFSIWGDTLADSLITGTFFTVKADEFGSVSGNVFPAVDSDVYITIHPVKRGGFSESVRAGSDQAFYFPFVPAGRYLLSGFLDSDGNGKYTPGSLIPFGYSEIFHFSADTIRVRKRWEVADVPFTFPEIGQ